MNILDAIRFNNIGIVKVKPSHGEVKYCIGTGFGNDEEEDANYIAMHGHPFILPDNFKTNATTDNDKS
jgi:hypothetical protein